MYDPKLGKKLRTQRELLGKSLSVVAKDLKIDKTHLSKIENGKDKPSKKLLQNIITYFSIPNSIALELLSLGGYKESSYSLGDTNQNAKVTNNPVDVGAPGSEPSEVQVEIPKEMQVLYTDSAFVTSSKFGIVFDFAQSITTTNKQMVVSRVGMSREHAVALFDALKARLENTKPKADNTEKLSN